MNHASLVPIVGLMKAVDYLGGTSSSSNSRQIEEELAALYEAMPPQKPRRSKQKGKDLDTYKFYTEKGEAASKLSSCSSGISSEPSKSENLNSSSTSSRNSPPKYGVERLTSELGTMTTTTASSNKGKKKIFPVKTKLLY